MKALLMEDKGDEARQEEGGHIIKDKGIRVPVEPYSGVKEEHEFHHWFRSSTWRCFTTMLAIWKLGQKDGEFMTGQST